MQTAESYVNERLDHLGIVAGVCQEIGLAAWLDEQDPTNRKPGERGNGDHGYDPEWTRFQQSSTLSGTPVLCRASRSNICWGEGSRRTCSTMIAWDAHWTGSTITIPRSSLRE